MGLRPKVNIQVNSAIGLVAQGGPATIAIIGSAQWGPIDEVQNLSNFSDGLSLFKEDKTGETLTMIKGLDLLYANGAGNVKAVRIENGSAAKATINLLGAGLSSSIQIDGLYKGSYGNNIMATVTANAVNAGNRDVELTDGAVIETYNNGGIGYSSNTEIVSTINANSNLVTATLLGTSLIQAMTRTNLQSGDDGASALTQADYTDALDNVLYNEDFDIVVIPGKTDDSFQSAILAKLNTRAGNDDRFAVYFSGVAKDETLPTIAARISSGQRLALVAPAIKYINRVDSSEQILDGSYLACAYAGVTALGYPELSATHKTLSVAGVMANSATNKEYYNNSESELLLQNRVVPITKISSAIQPVRAVTRHPSTTEVFYEQNIVQITDYVRKQALDILNPFIGSPNLQRTRTVMAKNIDGALEQDKLDEIIVDYLPTEITEGASPDTVNVSITIKPTFLVNFINVVLTLDNVSQ